MHIAIDRDDVVLDFFPRVVKCYNQEFDEEVEVSEITAWDENPIKESSHFGKGRAFKSWWDWWQSRAWLWADAPAVVGAISGLMDLHAQGHYIEIISDTPEWARPYTNKWLGLWQPYFDRLTYTSNGVKKHEVSEARILVDDKPDNVEGWASTGRTAFLFDRPWNQKINPISLVYRVSNWQTLIGVIGRL